jgi:predicted dehydrogenase
MNILVFGTSYMGEEYLKTIKHLGHTATVVGRDEAKAKSLATKYGFTGVGGGSEQFEDWDNYTHAIIATSVESLKDVTIACLDHGIANILVEKPGALDVSQLREIKNHLHSETTLRIAHNRRMYNSVQMLKQKIEEDGGAIGCFFDFTDREKDILDSTKDPAVLARWGFANSTHVIDAAFYLVGKPVDIHPVRAGRYDKHPSGTVFCGSGKTLQCPFSYFATWNGGGRWNVEISTEKGRYKLSPMEELQFCAKNQFAWITIEQPDNDDKICKAGLIKMISSFLEEGALYQELPLLDEQIATALLINKIFGYT